MRVTVDSHTAGFAEKSFTHRSLKPYLRTWMRERDEDNNMRRRKSHNQRISQGRFGREIIGVV